MSLFLSFSLWGQSSKSSNLLDSNKNLGSNNLAGNGTGSDLNGSNSNASAPLISTKFLESESLLNLSNNAFDTNSDAIDPENGTFKWKGKTFSLDQNYIFKSRFERYLSTPVDESKEFLYRDVLNDVMQGLSLINDSESEDLLQQTWEKLFELAEFESDGGNALILASQIHNAWRVRDEKKNIRSQANELERQRLLQEKVVINRIDSATSSMSSMGNRAKSVKLESKSNSENKQQVVNDTTTNDSKEEDSSSDSKSASVNSSTGALEVAMDSVSKADIPTMDPNYALKKGKLTESSFRVRDLVMTETKINALGLQGLQTAIQAKLQFQSQILGFFMQRRFEHVIIGAQFYRKIFKGSSQKLDIGHNELAQFFPNTDMTYTVDMIAQVSREALNDTNNSMKSIKNAYSMGDKIIALKRLQETFFLGEYVPSVYLFDDQKKQVLLEIYRKMKEAKDLFDVKDYLGVEEVISEIEEMADDFSSRQIYSAIKSAKNLSNYSISAAYQYREMGQLEDVKKSLQQAIEIWPSNPKIEQFQSDTNDLLSKSVKGTNDFDELLEREDYRAIFDRRNELGMSIGTDTNRLEELDEIVKKIATIDFLLAQSAEMVAQKNPYAAWETLENAKKLEPNDKLVNKSRADLALQVGNFVQKLDLAQRQEKMGRLAPSLTNFLAAQDIYPASQSCRISIERVSIEILDQMDLKASENLLPGEGNEDTLLEVSE